MPPAPGPIGEDWSPVVVAEVDGAGLSAFTFDDGSDCTGSELGHAALPVMAGAFGPPAWSARLQVRILNRGETPAADPFPDPPVISGLFPSVTIATKRPLSAATDTVEISHG